MWPTAKQKEPTRTLREFKGVNLLDAFGINPAYSPHATNTSSALAPALSVKPGFSSLGAPIGTTVLGLAVWKNQELHAVFNDGTWRKLVGSTWTTLKTGLSTTAVWSFVNFKGGFTDTNLIGANGIVALRYDGATVQPLANAPTGLNYVTQHDNRVYGAVGNRIAYCGIDLAEEWTVVGRRDDSSPGTIPKETYTGENINGISAGAGHATIFFPSSSWELYGTSFSDYQVIEVASDIGAINNQSSAILGGVLYFLDESGIYSYTGGVRPDKSFSLPVQAYVDGMNQAAKASCCMGADGRYLYVSIPGAVLVWDSIQSQWHAWNDVQPLHIAKMGDTLYMADNLGRVMRIGGTTNNGSGIAWEWQSKTFTSPSMSQLLRWMGLWLTIDKPADSTLQVYVTKEPTADSGWVLVGDMGAVAALQNRRIKLNPSQVAASQTLRLKLAGTGPCTVREIAWDERQFPIV
jgi:hypothetical protein